MQIVSCNIFHMHYTDALIYWMINGKWWGSMRECGGARATAFVKNHQETSCFICWLLAVFSRRPCAAVKSTPLQKVKKNISINKSDARNFQCAKICTWNLYDVYPICLMVIRAALSIPTSQSHTFYCRTKRNREECRVSDSLANERAVRERKRRRTKSRHLINWWICLLHVINVNHYTAPP